MISVPFVVQMISINYKKGSQVARQDCHMDDKWSKMTIFVAVILMFLVYAPVSLRTQFQSDSEAFVTHSIERSLEEGVYTAGGYMSFPVANETYYSTFGLQYKIFALLAFPFQNYQRLYILIMKSLLCLLFCLVLMGFVLTIKREFGPVAAWLTYGQILCAQPMMLFASNLYWVVFLSLLPFVATFLFYDSLRERKGDLAIYYGCLGLIVLLKSLCSYEYLTSILLACFVPIIYFEWKANSSLGKLIRRLSGVFIAGITGFAIAFGLNVLQARSYLGSWSSGWNAIIRSVVYRTTGDQFEKPISITNDLYTYFIYFIIKGQHFIFACAIISLGFLYYIMKVQSKNHSDSIQISEVKIWSVLLSVALLSSISWNSIAWGHMRYHTHVNFITFYLPFNLMVLALNGHIGSEVWCTIKGPANAFNKPQRRKERQAQRGMNLLSMILCVLCAFVVNGYKGSKDLELMGRNDQS